MCLPWGRQDDADRDLFLNRNYAMTVEAQLEAQRKGYSQVLWIYGDSMSSVLIIVGMGTEPNTSVRG